MKVLILGGVGITSSEVTKLALKKGWDVTLYNRGSNMSFKELGAKYILGDFRDKDDVREKLKGQTFDVIADFFAFTREHATSDYELFKDITKQYIFVSTCMVYEKPARDHIIREDSPRNNIYSVGYGIEKALCEDFLMQKWHDEGFPVTIVRPSHTYWTGEVIVPMATAKTQWTYLDRMLRGKKTIVHGDGTSLWTVTHNTDFAKGVVGLMGNRKAIGNAFHITSDKSVGWNNIIDNYAFALGVNAPKIHIASEFIGKHYYKGEQNLLADKAESVLFDNTKIKSFVPDFGCKIDHYEAARMCVDYYMEHPELQVVDEDYNEKIDAFIDAYLKNEQYMDQVFYVPPVRH